MCRWMLAIQLALLEELGRDQLGPTEHLLLYWLLLALLVAAYRLAVADASRIPVDVPPAFAKS